MKTVMKLKLGHQGNAESRHSGEEEFTFSISGLSRFCITPDGLHSVYSGS